MGTKQKKRKSKRNPPQNAPQDPDLDANETTAEHETKETPTPENNEAHDFQAINGSIQQLESQILNLENSFNALKAHVTEVNATHLKTSETHTEKLSLQLNQIATSWDKRLQEDARSNEQVQHSHFEMWEDLKQLLLSSRTTVLDTREKFKKLKRQWFKGRRLWLKYFKKTSATFDKHLQDRVGQIERQFRIDFEDFETKASDRHTQFYDQQRELQTELSHAFTEVHQSYHQDMEGLSSDIRSSVEKLQSHIHDSLKDLSQEQRNTFESARTEQSDFLSQVIAHIESAKQHSEQHQLASEAAYHRSADDIRQMLESAHRRSTTDQKFLESSIAQKYHQLEENIESRLDQSFKHIHDENTDLKSNFVHQSANLEKRFNEGLQVQFDQVKSHFEQLQNSFQAQTRSIEQQLLETQKTQHAIAKNIDQQVQKHVVQMQTSFEKELVRRLQTLLDDMASLIASQKGNWQEVVSAAKEGALKVGNRLSEEADATLRREIKNLALVQSGAFRNLVEDVRERIAKKIFRQLSPWRQKLGSLVQVGVMLGLLVGPYLLYKHLSDHMRNLGSRIEEKQALLEEELRDGMNTLRSEMGVASKYKHLANQKWERESFLDRRQPAKQVFIDRGPVKDKYFSLTFDGGANARSAKEILEILRKYKLQTTIFLTGEFIRNYPEHVLEILTDGHEVGNHSLKHDHMIDDKKVSLYTKTGLFEEFKEVERSFWDLTGRNMAPVWRAPFGEINTEVLKWAQEYGYTHIGWTRDQKISLDTLDWVADINHRWYRDPFKIRDHILNFEKVSTHGLNGAIILMHLGSDRPKERRAHLSLEETIETLYAKGYKNTPVSHYLK